MGVSAVSATTVDDEASKTALLNATPSFSFLSFGFLFMISVVMSLISFDVQAGQLTFKVLNHHLKFKVVQQSFDVQGGPPIISRWSSNHSFKVVQQYKPVQVRLTVPGPWSTSMVMLSYRGHARSTSMLMLSYRGHARVNSTVMLSYRGCLAGARVMHGRPHGDVILPGLWAWATSAVMVSCRDHAWATSTVMVSYRDTECYLTEGLDCNCF
jgi:hypothetical protein